MTGRARRGKGDHLHGLPTVEPEPVPLPPPDPPELDEPVIIGVTLRDIRHVAQRHAPESFVFEGQSLSLLHSDSLVALCLQALAAKTEVLIDPHSTVRIRLHAGSISTEAYGRTLARAVDAIVARVMSRDVTRGGDEEDAFALQTLRNRELYEDDGGVLRDWLLTRAPRKTRKVLRDDLGQQRTRS